MQKFVVMFLSLFVGNSLFAAQQSPPSHGGEQGEVNYHDPSAYSLPPGLIDEFDELKISDAQPDLAHVEGQDFLPLLDNCPVDSQGVEDAASRYQLRVERMKFAKNYLYDVFIRVLNSKPKPLDKKLIGFSLSDRALSHNKTEIAFLNAQSQLYAVIGGHGPSGSSIANQARLFLLNRCINKAGSFLPSQFHRISQEVDAQVRFDHPDWYVHSAATVAACHVSDDCKILHWMNCGDAQILVSSHNGHRILNVPHRPSTHKERFRILSMKIPNLSLSATQFSRAIGFGAPSLMKDGKKVFSEEADFGEHELTPADDFILLASPELWRCMSPQEVVTFVRKVRFFVLKQMPHQSPMTVEMAEYIAEELLFEVIFNPKRHVQHRKENNVSISIVFLNPTKYCGTRPKNIDLSGLV